MTNLKDQAVRILQDITDDKVVTVIEVLKGLQALYSQSEKKPSQNETPDNVMGIFNKYANPNLIPIEKEAWGAAVREKHAVN